jgi:hypothetical protein
MVERYAGFVIGLSYQGMATNKNEAAALAAKLKARQ